MSRCPDAQTPRSAANIVQTYPFSAQLAEGKNMDKHSHYISDFHAYRVEAEAAVTFSGFAGVATVGLPTGRWQAVQPVLSLPRPKQVN